MIGYSRVPSTLPGRRVAVTSDRAAAAARGRRPRRLRRRRLRRGDHLRVRRPERRHDAARSRPRTHTHPAAQSAQRRVERDAHLAAPTPVRGACRQRQPRQRRRDALRARPSLLGGRAGRAGAGFDPRQRRPRAATAAARAAAAQPRRARVQRVGRRRGAGGPAGAGGLRAHHRGPRRRCSFDAEPSRGSEVSTPDGARRSAVAGDAVGIVGELSFETAAAFEIRGRVAVGELRIDAIAPSPPRAGPLRAATALSRDRPGPRGHRPGRPARR